MQQDGLVLFCGATGDCRCPLKGINDGVIVSSLSFGWRLILVFRTGGGG